MSRTDQSEPRAFHFYRRLQRLRRYAQDNLSQGITLTDAATVAGMESTAFCHFFRRATGTSFKVWITALQVSRAQALFREMNYSVTEVAYASGFSSLRTFERTFRRVVGITPFEFKQQARPQPRWRTTAKK